MPDLENLKTLFPIFRDAEIGCQPGWYDLLVDLGLDLSIYAERHNLTPTISLVRSKFGELRVWIRCPDATDRQWEAIQDIEAQHYAISKTVCEQCGRKGRRVTVDGAIFTLCKACHHLKRCNP